MCCERFRRQLWKIKKDFFCFVCNMRLPHQNYVTYFFNEDEQMRWQSCFIINRTRFVTSKEILIHFKTSQYVLWNTVWIRFKMFVFCKFFLMLMLTNDIFTMTFIWFIKQFFYVLYDHEYYYWFGKWHHFYFVESIQE